MIDKNINLSIQILPVGTSSHPYDVIDKAIEVIQNSGLYHKVCPMETTIEGNYYKIIETITKAIETAYDQSQQVFVNIKIQIDKNADVSIDQKLQKYSD